MAGINMAQLTATGSAQASSAGKTSASTSSRESSRTDFASMIQDKVKETPQEKPDSDKSVKNQESTAGKTDQTGKRTDGTDKTDKADSTKPAKQDPAGKADQTEEKAVAENLAQLQTVLSQMMVQNLGETGDLTDQLTASAEALEAVAQGKVLEQVQEAVAGEPDKETTQMAAAREAQKEIAGSLKNFEAVAATPMAAAQTAEDKEAQKPVHTEETPDARIQELPVEETIPGMAAPETAGDSRRQETRQSDSQEGTLSVQDLMASTMTRGTSRGETFAVLETPGEHTVTVPTTPETFPQDVGNKLAASLPRTDGTLTIELEPASLGKMTIRVVYEAGKAAVSIVSENPRTLELLSQNASEIARILEEKTGQVTEVYTPDARQFLEDGQAGQQGQHHRQEEPEKKKHDQTESFTQMLRLGLV